MLTLLIANFTPAGNGAAVVACAGRGAESSNVSTDGGTLMHTAHIGQEPMRENKRQPGKDITGPEPTQE